MKKKIAYNKWKEKQNKDLNFWVSIEGRELQLNAVAQGYETNLLNIMLVLFGSEFIAIKIINNLREEICP